MNKTATIDDLAKSFRGLAGHFKKAAAHHVALSETHDGMAKACKAQHEFVKAKYDSMDDGDVDKAYFGKAAELSAAENEYHGKAYELHKVHGEHLGALADTLADFAAEEAQEGEGKAAGAAASAGDGKAAGETGVDAMIKQTTQGLVKKSLEMLNTDPEVANQIRSMVLESVKAALGEKIIPDGVSLTLPSAPDAGLKLIKRPGGPDIDTGKLDPKVAKFVAA